MTGFSFQDVLDDAVERSGGQEVTADTVLSARRSLRLMTEQWNARRFNTWRIERTVVGSASGASDKVSVPRHVDDIITASALRSDGSEVAMRRIGPSEYARLTDKDSEGESSQFWLSRSQQPVVYRYPTGPCQLVLWYVRRPADYDAYEDVTSDIPGRWLEAMTIGLAYDLARKRPSRFAAEAETAYDEALIARLRNEYGEAVTLAENADRNRQSFRYNATRRR